jgi:hypothetical protein
VAAAITTLRASLAAALSNPGVWSTFDFPPATINANSVIVSPDPAGYITPSNNTYAAIYPLANFKIIFTCPMFDNASNLSGIETMGVAVFNKLAASSIQLNIGAMSAPAVLEVASGSFLSADFTISVLTKWE